MSPHDVPSRHEQLSAAARTSRSPYPPRPLDQPDVVHSDLALCIGCGRAPLAAAAGPAPPNGFPVAAPVRAAAYEVLPRHGKVTHSLWTSITPPPAGHPARTARARPKHAAVVAGALAGLGFVRTRTPS
ncbi:hypothetical protein ABT063_36095 [Streptomyces sp. NPDC002838]|uniref:hypothetical protein n=1 Tax=Streptomyces sp. NPDC002838 TaxID=3154436 RepID=UPI0033236D62